MRRQRDGAQQINVPDSVPLPSLDTAQPRHSRIESVSFNQSSVMSLAEKCFRDIVQAVRDPAANSARFSFGSNGFDRKFLRAFNNGAMIAPSKMPR